MLLTYTVLALQHWGKEAVRSRQRSNEQCAGRRR